jgi:hypothetical protein
LTEEIDRLEGLVREKDSELSIIRQKYVDFNTLNNRNKEHLTLFVILFAEIECLRDRVLTKEGEIENIRKS